MEIEWIEYPRPMTSDDLYEASDEDDPVGRLFRYRTREDGPVKVALVGSINANGGACGCCGVPIYVEFLAYSDTLVGIADPVSRGY